LASTLSATRLANLTAQLEPHFLLNALNTISELMYSDPALARHLLNGLSQLLASVLGDQRATWTWAEERIHTMHYVDFIEARFGDRISVLLSLPSQLEHLPLPRFAIQGLVENAVKHNQDRRERLLIEVVAEHRGGHVSVSVADNGRGFSRYADGGYTRHGGLARLEQVLGLLYGPGARLERVYSASPGARVTLRLPNVP
ncbi:MAG: histidine kinase, partial [Polyangiales bacterium]